MRPDRPPEPPPQQPLLHRTGSRGPPRWRCGRNPETAPGGRSPTGAAAGQAADGQARVRGRNAVTPVLETESEGRSAAPNLYETDADSYLQDHALGEEVFGPLGLVIRTGTAEQMVALAKGFEGQLTATLHMDAGDAGLARQLLPVLERKAGRVMANNFPTGVEVCDAMVHGGPYPASTNFGATSVGTLAIRRFLRPVCFQTRPPGGCCAAAASAMPGGCRATCWSSCSAPWRSGRRSRST